MRKTAIVLVGLNLAAWVVNVAFGNYVEASFAFGAAVILSNFL